MQTFMKRIERRKLDKKVVGDDFGIRIHWPWEHPFQGSRIRHLWVLKPRTHLNKQRNRH